MKRWILTVQADSGEMQFLVEAKERPEFEDFWDTGEYVHSYRWVELTTEQEKNGVTCWLL
jgi:hypothetical protein